MTRAGERVRGGEKVRGAEATSVRRGPRSTKVGKARVVIVPDDYEKVLSGHPSERMQKILEAVWRCGYQRADSLEIVWCRPAGTWCPPPVRAWLDARARDDRSFKLREYPGNDFCALVGAEVFAARREADLTIVFAHSSDLFRDIARRGPGLSPVVLVGLEPGRYKFLGCDGLVHRVSRGQPWHFRRPPPTVIEVCQLRP